MEDTDHSLLPSSWNLFQIQCWRGHSIIYWESWLTHYKAPGVLNYLSAQLFKKHNCFLLSTPGLQLLCEWSPPFSCKNCHCLLSCSSTLLGQLLSVWEDPNPVISLAEPENWKRDAWEGKGPKIFPFILWVRLCARCFSYGTQNWQKFCEIGTSTCIFHLACLNFVVWIFSLTYKYIYSEVTASQFPQRTESLILSTQGNSSLLGLNEVSTVLNSVNASPPPPLLSFTPSPWGWAKYQGRWLIDRPVGRGECWPLSLLHSPENFVLSSPHGLHDFLSCLWGPYTPPVVPNLGSFGIVAHAQSLCCLSGGSWEPFA